MKDEMNMVVKRQGLSPSMFFKTKNVSYLKANKRGFICNDPMETIFSLAHKDKYFEHSCNIFINMTYEGTVKLQKQFFHSKLNLIRDIYELDQKCILSDSFVKNDSSNPTELQQDKIKIRIPEVRNDFKIKKILNEIVKTEKSYVRGLEELVEIYIKKSVPAELYQDSRTVFANVLPIFIFHKQFMLPEMINAINSANSDELIAKEFIKNKDFLKIYLSYISGFEDKIHIIKEWENSEKGKKYLKSRRLLQSHSQLNLLSYLLLPLQRIPRYKLLLFQLLQYQNSITIHSAFNQICFLVYNMNERKRQEEGSRRLIRIQQGLCYPNINIVEPWRKLIKESRMHYLLTTHASFFYDHLPLILDREVYVVLCNDILIIFNCTHTSILKIMNVKELQITDAWERPKIGLRFIFWELREIWHFDTLDNDADEWIAAVNKIHVNS